MKWLYTRSDYIYQTNDIYNLIQRRCINMNYEFSNVSIQISTFCNSKFHSHTSQRIWQLMLYLRNNKLLTLGFTVYIKHSMVCQPIKTFSIEQIKEAWKLNFLWQNVAIAANSQIDDGFHLVCIFAIRLFGYNWYQFYILYLEQSMPFRWYFKPISNCIIRKEGIYHDIEIKNRLDIK